MWSSLIGLIRPMTQGRLKKRRFSWNWDLYLFCGPPRWCWTPDRPSFQRALRVQCRLSNKTQTFWYQSGTSQKAFGVSQILKAERCLPDLFWYGVFTKDQVIIKWISLAIDDSSYGKDRIGRRPISWMNIWLEDVFQETSIWGNVKIPFLFLKNL